MTVRIYQGIEIDDARDHLLTDFGRETLADRYAVQRDDGSLESPQEIFARVAIHYGDDQAHSQRLYDYISKLWLMPSTPILSNGGTDRGFPISCFLNEVDDSLDGIWDSFSENKRLSAIGGGVGTYWGKVRSDLDKIRQRGKSSGVISFLKIQDAQTLAVSQGSLRRGSTAIYLPIDHPEVLDFIIMRRTTGGDENRKCLNLNNGLVITDEFMQAVRDNKMWFFKSPVTGDILINQNGETRCINARELCSRIIDVRMETGEPYLLFIDTVNRAVPEHHKMLDLYVKTSNLCLAGDTRIVSDLGMKSLKQLYDSQETFNVSSDNRTLDGAVTQAVRHKDGNHIKTTASLGVSTFPSSRVIKTGSNVPVLKITTKEGYEARGTEVHGFMTPIGWKLLSELKPGDKLCVQSGEGQWSSNRKLPGFEFVSHPNWTTRSAKDDFALPTTWSRELGCVLGWMIGDGFITQHRSNIRALVFGDGEKSELLPFFKDLWDSWFNGKSFNRHYTAGSSQLRMLSKEVVEFFKSLGVTDEYSENKRVPESIWSAPRDAVIGFLQALFGADGTVNVNKLQNGCTARLRSASFLLLQDVQKILLNFGIFSTIYPRRDAGQCLMPNGKRGESLYDTKPLYELVIGKANRNRFADLIGFITGEKQSKLEAFIVGQHKRGAYRELFEVEITAIVPDGMEDVYDIVVDKSHSFIANGIVVHNCSEITLPTSKERTAVCCLSSYNLATFNEWRGNEQFIEDAMRMLDNVLSDFITKSHRYPELKKARYSAESERSIGLGPMGWHEFLQANNIAMDSDEARFWNTKIFRWVKHQADRVSRKLADERGACPDAEQAGINERFSYKLSGAPTASISIICGGTSPSIEPFAGNAFTQKTKSGTSLATNKCLTTLLNQYGQNTQEVWWSIINNRGSVSHLNFLSNHEKRVFRTAYEIDQNVLVDLAAARAPFFCQAVSNNLFFPADAHKADVLKAHYDAWAKGVKSLYYCRTTTLTSAGTISGNINRIRIEERLDIQQTHEPIVIEIGDAYADEQAKYAGCESCQ